MSGAFTNQVCTEQDEFTDSSSYRRTLKRQALPWRSYPSHQPGTRERRAPGESHRPCKVTPLLSPEGRALSGRMTVLYVFLFHVSPSDKRIHFR